MAPKIFNATIKIHKPIEQHSRPNNDNHNKHNSKNRPGRKSGNALEADGGPCDPLLGDTTCPRCLKDHLPPSDGPLVTSTRRWWCTQRPATRRERMVYLDRLASRETTPSPPLLAAPSTEKSRREDELGARSRHKEDMGRERQRRRPKMVRLREDPVGEGVELAHDADAKLPTDRKPVAGGADNWEDGQSVNRGEPRFPLGEKYLDVETMLTMDDIRHEEPAFVIRTVAARRRRGGKGRAVGGGAGDEDEYEFVEGEDEDDGDVLSVAEWEELD